MVEALEAGADDCITKPFRFGELVAGCMPFFAGAVQTTLLHRCCKLAIWKIDFERRLRRRAGQEIRLTPTEFDLLALLMKNQAALLPHAKLLRIIWGPDSGDELQYLRTYVRTLRKKIENDPAPPKYILTEPWVGYGFHNPSEEEP